MCGISGLIGKADREFCLAAIKKIQHRGPDAAGIWLSGDSEFPASLCHTRLSVIDIRNESNQPFISRDGRFILVYNGEIYNYIELRHDLSMKGYVFTTTGDTEVLLYGLIDEGLEFMKRCNGMWAFCLWDKQSGKALIARDRFGVKPLYYCCLAGNVYAFSSEQKTLVPYLSSLELNASAEYMLANPFSYESTSQCMFSSIQRLPPGHAIVICNQSLNLIRWWNTLDNVVYPNYSTYSDQVDEWKEYFENSISIRLRSDIPIGCALSGGLDSSAIVAYIRKIQSNSLSSRIQGSFRPFCASYPGTDIDETEFAEAAALSCGYQLNKIDLARPFGEENLIDLIAFTEDPYITPPNPMIRLYAEMQKAGCKVSIDGHGADELFSGYGNVLDAITFGTTRSEFREIMAIYESTKSGIYTYKYRSKYKFLILRYIMRILRKQRGALINTYRSKPSDSLRNEIYCQNSDILSHPVFQEFDVFTQALYLMFHTSTLPTLLRNYDKYSMYSGVEVRMPFMDYRLVCITFGLPLSSKLGGGFTKRILRDSSVDILTDCLRTRRMKIGWNAPIHHWLSQPSDFKTSFDTVVDSEILNTPRSKLAQQTLKFRSSKIKTYQQAEKLWRLALPLLWKSSLKSFYWQ